MAFVDTSKLRVIERLPGWNGRFFHSANMTFAHYDFVRGSSIHEHYHAEEEVYEVIEGELEVTIDGVAQSRARDWWRSYPAMSGIRLRRSRTGGLSSSITRLGPILRSGSI